MTRNRRVAALAALALLSLPACAHRTPRSVSFETTAARQGVIDVENRTPDDLTIYLVRGSGFAIRIGRVPALNRRTLEVSAGMFEGSDVQLRAVRGHAHYSRGVGSADPSQADVGIELGGRSAYGTLPFAASTDRRFRWVIDPVLTVTGVS